MVARSGVVARGGETAMANKSYVHVPGARDDPPLAVTDKDIIKVANWILKGVQKAYHGQDHLLQHFCAWKHFPPQVVVPQYQEWGCGTLGDFNMELRKVLWSVDEFVGQAIEEIVRKDGAVVAECQGAPSFTMVATNEMPSFASWIHDFE